jgi:hypothetical protein
VRGSGSTRWESGRGRGKAMKLARELACHGRRARNPAKVTTPYFGEALSETVRVHEELSKVRV